jgi:hypothetical protein
MNHLTEEELVLYYYGEAPDGAPPDGHLAGCDECRGRYAGLQRVLNSMDSAAVPERGAEYGAAVWRRLEPELPRRRRWSWMFEPRRWAVAAAMAALLVAAFLTGRYSQKPGAPPSTAGITGSAGTVRERVLLVAMGDHLERSQMILVELENSSSSDITLARDTAADLVENNRLYRQTAASTGDVATASLLEDLERVLLEIANSPPHVSRARLDEMRKDIEARGILFKVKVFASEVEEREKRNQL